MRINKFSPKLDKFMIYNLIKRKSISLTNNPKSFVYAMEVNTLEAVPPTPINTVKNANCPVDLFV